MTPRRFIPYWERCLRRPLTAEEREAVEAARAACTTGKRDSVRAMRAALDRARQGSRVKGTLNLRGRSPEQAGRDHG